jgi:hypothetical protein
MHRYFHVRSVKMSAREAVDFPMALEVSVRHAADLRTHPASSGSSFSDVASFDGAACVSHIQVQLARGDEPSAPPSNPPPPEPTAEPMVTEAGFQAPPLPPPRGPLPSVPEMDHAEAIAAPPPHVQAAEQEAAPPMPHDEGVPPAVPTVAPATDIGPPAATAPADVKVSPSVMVEGVDAAQTVTPPAEDDDQGVRAPAEPAAPAVPAAVPAPPEPVLVPEIKVGCLFCVLVGTVLLCSWRASHDPVCSSVCRSAPLWRFACPAPQRFPAAT